MDQRRDLPTPGPLWRPSCLSWLFLRLLLGLDRGLPPFVLVVGATVSLPRVSCIA